MNRSFYTDTIQSFIHTDSGLIIGHLARNSQFSIQSEQISAWETEIQILKKNFSDMTGKIYFEYSIPRMGRRIDVLLIIKSAILILEFKAGEKKFKQSAVDQVWDYALDLKNFHEESHDKFIIPILIATDAEKLDSSEKFIFLGILQFENLKFML
ncbi:MAG TPA: hypothetical protein PLJ29_07895 [Leptospiraceae bacterium]|nr:hypothetical protein [Leptospiraceae bacterium]